MVEIVRRAAHDVDGTSVISVTGEVDVYTAPRLRAALDALREIIGRPPRETRDPAEPAPAVEA